MDFELSDEQRGLVDSTRSLLASKSSVDRARALIDGPEGFDAEVWRLGSQLGWPALAIPEVDGGLGQLSIDLALVGIELGRGLAATPFIPTVVAADALSRAEGEPKSKVLQSISEGSLIATWAFAESGRPWTPDGMQTRAERHGDGYRITGSKVSVQDADAAQLLLVDAVLDDAPARFLVPADAENLRIDRQQTLDVTRRYCDVTLEGVAVPPDGLVAAGDAAERSLARTQQLNTVLVCAELVGIGERLLAMTVDYVKNRVQFGRPVGSFQAVKHKCADMRIRVQASTAATYYAAMALDSRRDDIDHAVSVAKAYVSDAVNEVAGEALQLHGGIGFTWEHDLHLYLRRARVNSLLSGDARHHREQLCRMLVAQAQP
ncbi:acyl-CoA dehydrogenase family protein [Mycolicibacterium elephantis]|uniref:Acyl-CoA dehydrogenase n=1 Tax=Mycolicibacterium elephantis DSM 44368 TaxID=1335622 RepID=A0A439DVC9_9MYCO|nr:acyl-CoA dehydrogenase family protein [Mycolicibacterium elephantis]MCV7220726.1 acyl-CoA dehydrogenase family protein [Mycolicibacterium elephantis]RWA20987.1 acyl-CoA dehydrogenase [Mycolicibacterium elephantis DSM 44368]